MRELKFFVKEMISLYPKVKLRPLITMNSDRQMLSFVLKRLGDLKSDFEDKNFSPSDDEITELQILKFLLSSLKLSVKRNGAMPNEVMQFRKRVINMNSKQKQEEISRVILSSSEWV